MITRDYNNNKTAKTTKTTTIIPIIRKSMPYYNLKARCISTFNYSGTVAFCQQFKGTSVVNSLNMDGWTLKTK